MRHISLLFILLFISCKKDVITSGIDNNKPKQINLVKSSKKENLADYINNVKVLKLKTDINLIDLNKVVFYAHNYYVLDKKTSNLLAFNSEGVFLKKIGERGNGPGEYKKITDFEIDKANELILILSMYDKALYKFSLKGEFIDKVKLDFFVNGGFVVSDDNTYVFMPGVASSNFHSLVRTDTNGDILNYSFPFPQNMAVKGVSFSGGLHKQGKTNYFTEPTSSLIYEIKNSITPLYQFNFGNDTWKEDDRYNINGFINEYSKFKCSFLNNFYCDTDKVLAFNFLKERRVIKGFYFKGIHKALALTYNLEDSFVYKLLRTPIGIKGNNFISSLDFSLYEWVMASQEAIDFKEKYPEYYNTLKHDLKDFTENDNPYLLIYEVKDTK